MTETIGTLLTDWIEIQIQAHSDIPILFVSGAQGIGKSTALAEIERHFDGRLVILSLDDFYLTKAERRALADRVHPLFEVRGPPGTHDIAFLRETIGTLRHATSETKVEIPKFDKRIDDRIPKDHWTCFTGKPIAILVEGWCIGALPAPQDEPLSPLNTVEQSDPSGMWIRHQDTELAGPYAALWDIADAFFHLSAPSFDQVFEWRVQQEATTQGVAIDALPQSKVDWVQTFILHYERITKRMLSSGRRSGYVLQVDANGASGAKLALEGSGDAVAAAWAPAGDAVAIARSD
ncbi:MAG: hypothetical protein AAFV37_06460, partial [Pseudomonadota bacterium]